jgi:hypothetical protein
LHGNVGGLQSKDTDIVELTKHKLYNTNGICVIGKPCYIRLSLKEVALLEAGKKAPLQNREGLG